MKGSGGKKLFLVSAVAVLIQFRMGRGAAAGRCLLQRWEGVALVGTLGMRWSTLDLGEAHRLYVGGMSFSQVAAELGCTKSYVVRRFREAGIRARPSGRPLTTPAPDVDPADIVRLRDTGRSWPQIAAELGLSKDSVRDRYLIATGRPRRAGAHRPRPDVAVHEAEPRS